MPRSSWRRTTSVTASGSCCVSARSSFASHAAIKASGRGRLPAWLVKMWSELAFMILPVAVILPDRQVGLTGPSSKESPYFPFYLQEFNRGGSSSTSGTPDFRRLGKQRNGGMGAHLGHLGRINMSGSAIGYCCICQYYFLNIFKKMTTRLPSGSDGLMGPHKCSGS